MIAATPAAVELMCRGALALSAATAAGIRVDVPYVKSALVEVRASIKSLDDELRETEEYKIQAAKFGAGVKLTSDEQIAYVLYDAMGHTPLSFVKGGRPQINDAALQAVGTPWAKLYLKRKKLDKLQGTYLSGILREVVDGFIHPNYTLHNVITYRGASRDPNFQNQPNRNKMIAKYIRSAFVPRAADRVILEIDLKQNEVRVSACYSLDEKLIYDTLHGDMHLDMAAECFILPKTQVSKAARNEAKGDFVFAEFYGSYYPQVAKALWREAAKITTTDGTPLLDHLARKKITERGKCETGTKEEPIPGSFEAHIKRVERRFWGERFKVHDEWRRTWWADYQRNGYFQMLSGFVVTFGKAGPLGKNDCINSPSQGSAFHCLLWGFIRLHDWFKKYKMQSVLIGQIHDSVLIDAHISEVPDIVAKARALFIDDVRVYYPWLKVPLDLEVEIAETNWYEKRPL